jgi:ferredoxin
MAEPKRYLILPVPMDTIDDAGDYQRAVENLAETWEMPRPRRRGDWDAVIDPHRHEACPTCQVSGPDFFHTDDEGHVEADCGDEYHDQFLTQSGRGKP